MKTLNLEEKIGNFYRDLMKNNNNMLLKIYTHIHLTLHTYR